MKFVTMLQERAAAIRHLCGRCADRSSVIPRSGGERLKLGLVTPGIQRSSYHRSAGAHRM